MEEYKTFRKWSNSQVVLGLYEVEKNFLSFINQRIEELEKLQKNCETDCERQANLRVINELKRLSK